MPTRARHRRAAATAPRRAVVVLLAAALLPAAALPAAATSPTATSPTARSTATSAAPTGLTATAHDVPHGPVAIPDPTRSGSLEAPPTRSPQPAVTPAGTLVVVNKQRPLEPLDYAPRHLRTVAGTDVELRQDAAAAAERLLADAARAGVPLLPRSGFRSYETQVDTYAHWADVLGPDVADTQSARPGHSEHQTGLALDVLAGDGTCREFGCFGDTPQAAWLAEHAPAYGFVVRYQEGQEAVTGYTAEPWHLRYVGTRTAADLTASEARSLEEYLGLPAAPSY
ncbi:D-alanyl-D-alanine carboxypeptidase family protein [Puerhibacterium sp. TATVAM-FAB25]|uniref:M15 family metallopeptidase n=1 Tax=Puerhibacterium sp. TATVAM-FAB25 TaxID=3093699 RepID=UPI00397B41FC